MVLFLLKGREVSVMSSGQRFMTDLLVSSLMADGGLETSLNLAVKAEIKELEEKKVCWLICRCVHSVASRLQNCGSTAKYIYRPHKWKASMSIHPQKMRTAEQPAFFYNQCSLFFFFLSAL